MKKFLAAKEYKLECLLFDMIDNITAKQTELFGQIKDKKTILKELRVLFKKEYDKVAKLTECKKSFDDIVEDTWEWVDGSHKVVSKRLHSEIIGL
jgi:hypothetical protein